MSAMQYIDYWVRAKKNDFCVICMTELHLVYGFFSVVKRIMGIQVSRLLSGGKGCEDAFVCAFYVMLCNGIMGHVLRDAFI